MDLVNTLYKKALDLHEDLLLIDQSDSELQQEYQEMIDSLIDTATRLESFYTK